MSVERDIKQEILSLYKKIFNKIIIDGIYLFGSYAKGNADSGSDIDVAILSNEFEGIRFYDSVKISKILIHETYPTFEFAEFEIHPFKTDLFNEEDPLAEEIIRTGIKIV